MREIEAELDQRLTRSRARMLQDSALQSQAVDWQAEGEPPVCPECGQGLKADGWHQLGTAVWSLSEVWARLFPLDEELELLPGQLTLHAHEYLVRLGAWLPFGRSAEMIE